MTKIFKWVVACFVALLLFNMLRGCTSEVKKDHPTLSNNTFNASNTSANSSDEAPVPLSNWSYNEDKDAMTDNKRYFANTISTNRYNLEFPYHGGTSLHLIVRKMDGANEVILKVDPGQFSSSYSESVKIKFDDEPVKTYSYNSAADGSSDVIFLNNSTSIIKKLKIAKRVKIQPQLYQAGQTVFEFNVGGFEWKH